MRSQRSKLTPLARGLRVRSTDAERWLWSKLRARQLNGLKFRRQVPLGPYNADFLCVEPPLIIELDGGQHAEDAGRDAQRSNYLNQQGYRVLRFWNDEALTRRDDVLEEILRVCGGV